MIFKEIKIQTELVDIPTNSYAITDEKSKETVIVDPATIEGAELIKQYLDENNFRLKYIIYTHVHLDHIAGINKLKQFYPKAEIVGSVKGAKNILDNNINCKDMFPHVDTLGDVITDKTVKEGDILKIRRY